MIFFWQTWKLGNCVFVVVFSHRYCFQVYTIFTHTKSKVYELEPKQVIMKSLCLFVLRPTRSSATHILLAPLCISSLTCVYIVTEGVADSVWVCVLECNCENCKLIHAKCVCMCVWVCNESRAQYSPISVRDADVTFAMLLMMLVVGCLMIIEWLVECGWMSVTSSLAAIRRRSVLFGAL